MASSSFTCWWLRKVGTGYTSRQRLHPHPRPSPCDRRLHFKITATCPSDCRMCDCFPLCYCFTSTTFCLAFCECFSMTLALGQCAPSDDWTSLGLSLFSLIILTGGVSIDPGKKNHTSFCGFLFVCFPRFLVTNKLHTQNTSMSTKW